MSQQTTPWFDHQPRHDHHCLLYETQEEQFETVIPFIEEGLEDDDFCLYVLCENTRDQLTEAFNDAGIDVDSAIKSGQLAIHHADEMSLTEDDFTPSQTTKALEERVNEAVDAGYNRLRIAGETGSALGKTIDIDILEKYEMELDEFFPSDSMVALCQYKRSSVSSEHLCSVLKTHPSVIHRSQKRLNCYYQLPEEHAEDTVSSSSVDRKLKTISEQQRTLHSLRNRERCLSLLQQANEQLQHAEPDEVEDIASEVISEIVDPVLITFHSYDEAEGELQRRVVHGTLPEVKSESLTSKINDCSWDAFVDNHVYSSDLDQEGTLSGYALPVGQHGVFCITTDGAYEISDTDLHSIQAICGHTKAALDRTGYETDLEKKNGQLETKNKHLERLNRINSVVREINRSLVNTSSTSEILENACEYLVEETRISFSWYGNYDSATDSLKPTKQAGEAQSYLEALELGEEWPRQDPTGKAIKTKETQIWQSIYDEPPLEHWQKQALKREFRSAISLPVSFDSSMYGVLTLYGELPDLFDEEIVSVLEELSDTLAYAINNIKQKQALITNTVTELKINATQSEFEIIEFAREHDWEVEITDVVAGKDDNFSVFSTIQNADAEEIKSFATATPTVAEAEILHEDNGTHRCATQITEQCFITDILNHNAVPQSVTIENQEAYLIVHLPHEESVRSFMEMFRAKHPKTNVVARSTKEQSLRRIRDIEQELEENLTDRQLEILKLAYHSGYFSRPRERTAEELAKSLDVSHPTVSRHLREAERRVFTMLLEDS